MGRYRVLEQAIWLVVFACFMAGFLATVWYSSQQSPHAEHSYTANTNARSDASYAEKIEAVWKRTFEDPVAFYTLVLSIFTGSLAIISIVQIGFLIRAEETSRKTAQAAKDSADAARQEFISTHRPRIRIKHVFLTSEIWEKEEIEIKLIIVNIGDTPAHIIECCVCTAVLETASKLPARPEYGGMRFTPEREKLPSGKTYIFPKLSDSRVLSDADSSAIRNGSRRLYCYGFVEYLDVSEERRLKTTAFCRVLEPPASPVSYQDVGRFVKYDDPNYEYQD